MTESLSPSGFAALLPAPPRGSAEWSIFSCLMVEPPPQFEATFADHVLTLQQSGAVRAREVVSGRSKEGWCGAGCVGVLPADVKMTWDASGTRGVSRATCLFIPDAFVSRVVSHDWNVEPKRVEITWQFLERDPIAEGVLTRLTFEAANDAPSGCLYAESACEFLAHHVIRSYSSLAGRVPRMRGGLPGHRLRLVTDYIHDNLSHPISLRQLAELAGVSPRHFERAFRQAVGVPPYTYVMRERVTAARHLLLSRPNVGMEQVAARVGFGSASHLASAFRRHTGYSPRTFRALHSR